MSSQNFPSEDSPVFPRPTVLRGTLAPSHALILRVLDNLWDSADEILHLMNARPEIVLTVSSRDWKQFFAPLLKLAECLERYTTLDVSGDLCRHGHLLMELLRSATHFRTSNSQKQSRIKAAGVAGFNLRDAMYRVLLCPDNAGSEKKLIQELVANKDRLVLMMVSAVFTKNTNFARIMWVMRAVRLSSRIKICFSPKVLKFWTNHLYFVTLWTSLAPSP